MNTYRRLPTENLLAYYYEITKEIKEGIISKSVYFELGLIISVASERGITLGDPFDIKQ
ncbi:hypothetical protein [Alkalihalobacterium elongatum]|uniref:hypothetical protein n=1 Tax=Alkalihalobacterium elongatum TaxID=2675466 RepID=UPI001C1F3459|nr:hypothetical protein [Alkalihalobacterium elongatum]